MSKRKRTSEVEKWIKQGRGSGDIKPHVLLNVCYIQNKLEAMRLN